MNDTDSRIQRLEFRADAQDKEIASLQTVQATFGKSLQAIENTLTQIKYALYGAGAVFLLQTVGLKEAVIKLFLH